jgi:hypothetical protein
MQTHTCEYKWDFLRCHSRPGPDLMHKCIIWNFPLLLVWAAAEKKHNKKKLDGKYVFFLRLRGGRAEIEMDMREMMWKIRRIWLVCGRARAESSTIIKISITMGPEREREMGKVCHAWKFRWGCSVHLVADVKTQSHWTAKCTPKYSNFLTQIYRAPRRVLPLRTKRVTNLPHHRSQPPKCVLIFCRHFSLRPPCTPLYTRAVCSLAPFTNCVPRVTYRVASMSRSSSSS